MRFRSGFGIGFLALTFSAVLVRIRKCPGRHRLDYRHRERSVRAIVPGATVTITHEGQGPDLTSVTRGGRHLHLHADPHRSRIGSTSSFKGSRKRRDAASRSASRNRSAPISFSRPAVSAKRCW